MLCNCITGVCFDVETMRVILKIAFFLVRVVGGICVGTRACQEAPLL